MRAFLPSIMMLFLAVGAHAAVKGDEVTYKAGDAELKGYLVFDDSIQGKRPGVLVVHEWWGLNDYARKRAQMLAELGYTALAVDMYGGGKTASHPDDAKKFSGELRQNMPMSEKRFLAGLETLRKHPSVDSRKIAAVGYCFGGGIVLHMARSGVDLKGVVSLHGTLETQQQAKAGQIKAKVLVLNGGADPMVPPEQIAAFSREMAEAGVGYHFVNYPGAKHAFTNPEADEYGRKFKLPLAYDREADRQSWQEMREFLAEIFR